MCWKSTWATTFALLQIIALEPATAQVHNLILWVEEGQPAGTIVGDLRALMLGKDPSSGFFISESRESYIFKDLEIDGETGIICTAVVLDRESKDKYEFVAATLTGEMIKVHIMVRDINDNSPMFPSDVVELKVSEQSLPGTRFHLEGADDEDEGEFGTMGYRISDTARLEMFQVEYRNGGVDVILIGSLDREVEDFHSLTIEAFDGGVPPRIGRLQVNVYVLDENDNPPVFSQSEYHTTMWENAVLLTPVCQVHAMDPDLGENGRVMYEINRRQSDSKFFTVDGDTGWIYVNNVLDYETQPFHQLIITAWDQGVQPEYSSTFVVVRILDVNDNSPIINVLFLSESREAEVDEAAETGLYLAMVSVSDPDLGLVKKVNVSLEGGRGKFVLQPSDDFLYSLCVGGELDREQVDLYELKIVASDFGDPPLCSEKVILIKVTDVNDSPPVFEHNDYIVNISEDTSLGSVLLHVQATDLDEGINSAVIYSVVSPQHGYLLNIDPQTGLVITAEHLDYEREVEFFFLVVAIDGGSPPLSSTATVTVYVEDVNDNVPVFGKPFYEISVPEHRPVGCYVLQVTANDADSGEFGRVLYSLHDGLGQHEGPTHFYIQEATGEICMSKDIDRDVGLTSYDMLVKAEDQGGLSAQAYIHIEIVDINDNRPIFYPETYTTTLSSRTVPPAQILTVFAKDRDAGIMGQVSYQLLPGNMASLFSLEASTGVLHLNSTLHHLGNITSITLSVLAVDGAGLSSSHPAEVTVNILRHSASPVIFQRSNYLFSLPENAPVGAAVGEVHGSSPANLGESISYRISSGDPLDLLYIDSKSGVISTCRVLDRETQPYILLMVQACTDSSPICGKTQVNITITDVNDNAPVFPREREFISISRSTAPATLLFIVHAVDQDCESNGRIQYSLTSEDGAQPFIIDSHLGVVLLNQSLIQDSQSSYSLQVQAKDEGTPIHSSMMRLSVEVDNSRHTLLFTSLVYQVQISEFASRDTRVIQIWAHWRNPLTKVFYSLHSTTRTIPFKIHRHTGWIFLTQTLDHESTPMFYFKVLATLFENGTLVSSEATVEVTVLDENDNSPVFTQELYFYTVPEGPRPGGIIGTVRATDKDSGRNSQLSYMLVSDGGHFHINSCTGEIVNWVALDREHHNYLTLWVLATDHGSPHLNAMTQVHVLITDINDNPPQFIRLPPGREDSLQVWAALPTGSVVANMVAKDLDAGRNGTVRYSLISEDYLDHFEIDSRSGMVTTTPRFSDGPNPSYKLSITASDYGPTPLEVKATLHVQVLGLEGGKHHMRHFYVREDEKPGTVIGLLGDIEEPHDRMRYSISEGDGCMHFAVDTTSGRLYINHKLDYEVASGYFFTVSLVDSSQSPVLNLSVFVSITVLDANDHTPMFQDEIVLFGLEEDLDLGSHLYTFNALDEDSGWANSALQYSLISESPVPFQIDALNGALAIIGPVDREQTHSYVFTVSVADQADDPEERRCASQTVQVFLLDVNDNSPVFVSPGVAHIMEDTVIGDLVHRFFAKDADMGDNGKVVYGILKGNEEQHFVLDGETGLLLLALPLDYELTQMYILVVEAVDKGHPALTSTQTLTVSILDINDQSPTFENSVYRATVSENRAAGELLLRVTACDNDSEINSAVNYSLLPSPGYKLFTIDSHSGEIHTAAPLDREVHELFTLRVVARDSGSPPLSSTATIICVVLDDNDNTPHFIQPCQQISIPENIPPDLIYTVHADDPDTGANGTVRYRIKGDSPFVINASSGAISTVAELDREDRSHYTLTIVACDQGFLPRCSSTELQVLVLDENDNNPTFQHSCYRVSVYEDVAVGTVVLQLDATDRDQGPAGQVTYALLDDAQGVFSIEPDSGKVKTAQPLDRENRDQHSFRVVATDACAQGPRSTVVSVVLKVEDVNDNPPALTRNPVIALLSADSNLNQTVVTVSATDRDRGENGTLGFTLSEPDAFFDVCANSGQIWLKSSVPSSGFFPTKTLQVIASDRGTPALSSTALVFILVDGEESTLSFSQQVYNTAIPENSKTGLWVLRVSASTQGPHRRPIQYSIFSGNEDEAFSMNPNAGDILVKQHNCLDFEKRRTISLVVLADDGQQMSHCRVSIALLDRNDNAPAFAQESYRQAVPEGQMHNTYVMQELAVDNDSGINGKIEYSIMSGNYNNAFVIDSVLGILTTNTVLDREIISSYMLVLRASDSGSPSRSGTATVHIQVVDINDNSPVIPPMEPCLVAEHLPIGHIVTQVTANDVDLGTAVTYSLAEGGSSFTIDSYTGVIRLSRSLDYEVQSNHMVTVKASDSLHETEARLTIQVTNTNDNLPVFISESYQVVLPELSPANIFIQTLTATDKDSGVNGKVTYKLLSSACEGFYIGSENGALYTTMPLKEITNGSMIQLLVEAQDGGDPALSTVTSVDIHIQHTNYHPPCFQQEAYQISTPEDTQVGTTLLLLLAEDPDDLGGSGHLFYSITGGNEEKRFCVETVLLPTEFGHRFMGRLVLCNGLDRETTESFMLTVTVYDMGKLPLDSSTTVAVTVLDVNDHAPTFDSTEYHVQISDGSRQGNRLIQVSAHDCDKGVNAHVRYDIVSGNSKGWLRLDTESGFLEVNRSLSYEQESKLTLTIQAADGDSTKRRNIAFTVVHILVLDENDHPPFFPFPVVNCSVEENMPGPQFVCSVRAVDFDAGPCGEVTYSIISFCLLGNDSGSYNHNEFFTINEHTGEIHSQHVLDYEKQTWYCLLVEARDQRDQVASLRVQISVEGMDEFSPVFTQLQYYFQHPGEVKLHQSIARVIAMDKDDGLDGVVVYSFVVPSKFFTINKTSGDIYFSSKAYSKDSVLREESSELIVMAHSPKLGSRSATCLVHVSFLSPSGARQGQNVHSLSLGVGLVVFLLLFISFLGQALACKIRRAPSTNRPKVKKVIDTFEEKTNTNKVTGMYLDMRVKEELRDTSRNSDSSGRGSAEVETAEDKEIMMINEHSCSMGLGSALIDRASRAPDLSVPQDQRSGDPHPDAVALQASNSVHSFEQKKGEKRFFGTIRASHTFMPESLASIGGLLTSLESPEEAICGSYDWDYLLDWGPRFQPLAAVFSDIGLLEDRPAERQNLGKQPLTLLRPPPLITRVAQPGIRNVPPHMPPSFPKYTYPPLVRNTGLTPSAMTPSFTPALSMLTMRTPNASPVLSGSAHQMPSATGSQNGTLKESETRL